MVLLDVSATGEENVIEFQAGNEMNDLEYRRAQLQKLQDAVIDLEDLSSGVSIADLTLNDFRIDLAGYLRSTGAASMRCRLGPTRSPSSRRQRKPDPAGRDLLLARRRGCRPCGAEPGYPLAPHYVVHVGDDGEVLLPYTQAKQVLDRLKKLSLGRDQPEQEAYKRFDKATRSGRDMEPYASCLPAPSAPSSESARSARSPACFSRAAHTP